MDYMTQLRRSQTKCPAGILCTRLGLGARRCLGDTVVLKLFRQRRSCRLGRVHHCTYLRQQSHGCLQILRHIIRKKFAH